MPATAMTVGTHQKSEGKSYLDMGPVAKMAIFGQKVPKIGHYGARMARNGDSDPRI